MEEQSLYNKKYKVISMQALCVDMDLHVHFNPCFSPYKKKLLVKFICMATYCFFFQTVIWGCGRVQRFSTPFGFLANMSTT